MSANQSFVVRQVSPAQQEAKKIKDSDFTILEMCRREDGMSPKSSIVA